MSIGITGIHHVAIITANYSVSKAFYVDILGASIIAETWRAERDSYKLDLMLPGGVQIELFSFPSPPSRVSRPEACGLRHLAFSCEDIAATRDYLESKGVPCEEIRVDELTQRRFTFFSDPDGTPLELYESHLQKQ